MAVFDVWNNVLAELEQKISQENYATFFAQTNTSLISTDDGMIQIGVPNIFMQANIRKKFDQQIRDALVSNKISVKNTNYVIVNNATRIKKPREVVLEDLQTRVNTVEKIKIPTNNFNPTLLTGLNNKFTMDNFVVGTNNELAVAVAKNIIENPGDKYNPFFLYGGPGLGKTHLVEAIGNGLLKRNPKLKILYTPINHFYSDFITAVRKGDMENFHKKFQKLDVLIIDDFQFIVGKEKSQEEFFNIFNDMHQANKQVIITSDRLPSQIKTVDERLASRLTMTGAFDLQYPTFEDRCAILHAKAEFDGVDVENQAIEYIAKNVETNIRDLQSLYGKIIALSELKGVSPLSIIQDGLASISTGGVRSRNLTPKTIVGKVSDYYNITPDELCGKSRVSNIKTARQVAMFLMSKDLQMSTPKIALEVGVKDHTTVMHGIKKIESDMKLNFSLRDEINELREQLSE